MNAVWADGNAITVQPTQFLKLNVDCWENIFDYLSFHDIISMSKTCKRMQQIAGHYYQDTFRSCSVVYQAALLNIDGILGRKDFLKFIHTIILMIRLDHFLNAQQFCSLTYIQLMAMTLNETQASFMKDVLSNVQVLYMDQCYVKSN